MVKLSGFLPASSLFDATEQSNKKEKIIPRKRKPYSITHNALIEQLFTAYFDARRSKRGTNTQLLFEQDFEHNLMVLAREIEKGTYEVGRSVCFVTNKPVKREIFAADFRDRIVHHLLCNWLSPMFERSFIADCYSCRKGKGTLYGIKRTHQHIRQCTQNFTQPGYVLKVDISGYFMSINRQRLLDVVVAEMEKYRHRRCGYADLTWEEYIDYALAQDLLRKIILNNPTLNCIFRGRKDAWEGLPRNKSLFYSAEGCGLPIGNLTSQLFSNVYLSSFDNLMKRKEGLKYYGRYVDDMIIVHRSRKYLSELKDRMAYILSNDYGLYMHPKKWVLQPATCGINFLGMRLYGNVLLPGERLKRSFYRTLSAYYNLSKGNCTYAEVFFYRSCLNSYLGQLAHCSGFGLRKKVGFMLYNMSVPYLLIDKSLSKVDIFPMNVLVLELPRLLPMPC